MLKSLVKKLLGRRWWKVEEPSPTKGAVEIANDLRLALARQAQGEYDAAEALYRAILLQDSTHVDAMHLLGFLLTLRSNLSEAVRWLEAAAALRPESAEIQFNLGLALYKAASLEKAAGCFRKAVSLRPDFTEALTNLAGILRSVLQHDEAEACFRRVIQLGAGTAEVYCNLGNVLLQQGRPSEAICMYKKAVEIDPHHSGARSNIGYVMNFDPHYTPEDVSAAHREWSRVHAEGLKQALGRPPNDRSSGRRLRIGYVSPDFRQHAVCYFVEPVLRMHDRENFEVYCYSDVARPDLITRRLQGYRLAWRDIAGLEDAAVAAMVREDRVDILVDLAGHTNDNRMLMFARKPAPVQVSWPGYTCTTGMSAMDYRIVDAQTDPPGMTEHLYSEKLFRLSRTFVAFNPLQETPPVGSLPAASAGYVTFGAFAGRYRASPFAIELWADILNRNPDSRLIVLPVSRGTAQETLRDAFRSHGIPASRIDIRESVPHDEFLAAHQFVDIMLDTVPCNGMTTTCHSLWMGVPVITLPGRSYSARAGASILSSVGLEQFVAGSPREYCDIACNLAGDLDELAKLRGSLRGRVQQSTLTDAAAFTAEIEVAYRRMWHDWVIAG